MSRKLTTMTRSVARPSNVGVLWEGNLYRGFTVATDFLVHYLRIFRAKDISTARSRRRKDSFGAETMPLVSSYTGY